MKFEAALRNLHLIVNKQTFSSGSLLPQVGYNLIRFINMLKLSYLTYTRQYNCTIDIHNKKKTLLQHCHR